MADNILHLFRIPSIHEGQDHLVAALDAESACRILAEKRAFEHFVVPKTQQYLKREPEDLGEHSGEAGVVAINKDVGAAGLQ